MSKYPRIYGLTLLLISVFIINGNSQTDYTIINTINITGNENTKPYVILKALDFKEGDTILLELPDLFYKNENRLYDTKLFNKVKISYQEHAYHKIDVNIQLEKAWYVFPAPIFEIGAENFNTWWKDYHCSPKWIDYGIRLSHINLTGNQDALKLVYQSGFTQKYEINYNRPFIFKSDIGFSINAYYATKKSTGYETIGGKLVYYENDDKVVLSKFRLDGSLYHRPNPFLYQLIKLQYHHKIIDSAIAELNPDYFLNGKTDFKYLFLEYHIKYDKRVFKLYPNSGYMGSLSLKKEGVGIFHDINNWSVSVVMEQYYKTKLGVLLQTGFEIRKQLLKNPIPYSSYSAIGYSNNFVRGYESYIIDGADYFVWRNAIRKELKTQLINFGYWMPLKPYRSMHSSLYVRFNMEFAYVNDPFYASNNLLTNNLLLGFGPAFDLILYHNHLFSLEFNINRDRGYGIYLHNNITF